MTEMRVIRFLLVTYFVIHSEEIGADEGVWTFVLLDETVQSVLIRVDLPPMAS